MRRKPLNDEGVYRLAERVLFEAANDYMRLWLRKLQGFDESQRLSRLEEWFYTSPFVAIVPKSPQEVIDGLRVRAKRMHMKLEGK